MSTGNIVVSQDAPAKNNLWIQPKGTARFWNGSIWKTISGGSGDITLVDLMGSSAIGTQYSPLYWTGSVFSPITYTLSSTINTGTANALAYYSGTNAIDDALHLRYYEGSSTASTPASYYRLHLYGSTYGNTAANMISGTAGLFSFGDGGPQITFDTNATPGGSQAGALIFTDHDTAATGASWHFVSNQSDWNVTSKRFHARTGISVGTNLPNTSYNFYVNGTSYLNGVTEIPNLLYINDYIRLGQGGNVIDGYRKSTSAFAGLHLNYYSNGNTTLSYGGGNVGIGTTSPSYKLEVNGSALVGNTSNTSNILYIKSSVTQLRLIAYDNYCYIESGSSNWSSSKDLYITGYNTNNLGNLHLKADTTKCYGDFYATGGVTALATNSSDKRLKKNIKKFNATEIINKLQPISFEWNDIAKKYNNNFENGTNYGLIAQDSDDIIDNLVFDLPDNSGYKGVRYEKLIPILLQAIKELKEEIEKLKNKKT